ncbi:DUF6602 domain-containing protein [Nocardia sp. NPDC049737]|uniref:DUF6602 domain-containing protein n=1 Tax=Nocardia sp. NPDC049737 TaxID=3154358 RepID=UPI003448BFB8
MSILEEYWSGVLRRLQAEVDSFNRLIAHQGEKGRENELALARILERLVPARYGIGSGLLIDSQGGYSKQIDIVVYDQADQPALMAQTTQVLFPVEFVHLCIEVKTTVDGDEIGDAIEKRNSVNKLASRGGHPAFAFVGYNSSCHPPTIAQHLRAPSSNDRIDIACVLQSALFAARGEFGSVGDSNADDYIVGVTALQDTDEDGKPLPGTCAPLTSEDGAYVLRGDRKYPTVKMPGDYVIAEPSRALLLFCEAVLNALKPGDEKSVMSHYVTDVGRELIYLG